MGGPSLTWSRVALFLDFDGTLVDLAPTPDAVRLAPETRSLLAALHRGLTGACAIVTGRDIADVDRHLQPLTLPVAGSHGAARRGADGRLTAADGTEALLDRIAERLSPFATQHTLLVERKAGAVSLHFRNRPDLEEASRSLAAETAATDPGLRAIQGDMVAEVALARHNKGAAVDAFMAEPPFAGRLPVAVGDDTTDEDAFAAVNRLGGTAIKIGSGPSCAGHRFADNTSFLAWLHTGAAQLSEGHA